MSIYIKAGSAITYLQSILNNNTNAYQKNLEQISSGNKYTKVGENPINVCESVKLQVKIDSNNQASDNISVGQSMLSMTEGYHSTIIANIQRIRDLSQQAANGTYGSDNIDAILSEIKGRLGYINKISSTASFDGVGLLDGSSSSIFLQIGSVTDATMDVGDALIDTHTANLGIDLPPTVTGANWDETQVRSYLTSLDNASQSMLDADAKIGGYLNRLDAASLSLSKMNDNLTENKSIITDTDVAAATADMVKNQILQEASASVLLQANQVSSWALQLLGK